TDEAFCAINWDIGIIPAGSLRADNVTSVSDTHWTGGGGLYYWDTGYQYVRRINIFLEKMGDPEIAVGDKDRLVAEAKFLGAYIYFLLVERFCGVPIVSESFDLGSAHQFTRNSFEEVVPFIEKALNEP